MKHLRDPLVRYLRYKNHRVLWLLNDIASPWQNEEKELENMIKMKALIMDNFKEFNEGEAPPTAGIILRSEHLGVVLVKEKKHWGIPKGRLEWKESPLEGACRETIEETSIFIKAEGCQINTPVKEVAVLKNSAGGKFYVYECNLKMPVIPKKSHEHEEVRYFKKLPDDVDPRLKGLL